MKGTSSLVIMVIAKELGMVDEKYPNVFLIKNTKKISKSVENALENIQKEIHNIVEKYPKETKELNQIFWEEKKELLYPVYVTSKQVMALKTDVLFQKENYNSVHQDDLHQRKLRVDKQIEECIIRLEKKEVVTDLVDEFFSIYEQQKEYIEKCQQFLLQYKDHNKRDSFVFHIDPELYEQTKYMKKFMNENSHIFTTELTKEALWSEVKIEKRKDGKSILQCSFLQQPIIYKKQQEILQWEIKTVWELFATHIEKWNVLKKSISFDIHPLFTETKKIFVHMKNLEEIQEIYQQVKELEKEQGINKLKTNEITYIMDICIFYFSYPFPGHISELKEKDLCHIPYGKISYFLNVYKEDVRYPQVEEVKRVLVLYRMLLENERDKKERLTQIDEICMKYQLNKRDIKQFLHMTSVLSGRCGMNIYVTALLGEQSKNNLEKLSGFGLLKSFKREKVKCFLNQLMDWGILENDRNQYVFLSEKGKQMLEKGFRETRRSVHSLKWNEFEDIIDTKTYTEKEKEEYVVGKYKGGSEDLYRCWLEAACESIKVACYILPWLKEHYHENMAYIFDLYRETKTQQHVKFLLKDIQKVVKKG